MLDRKRFAVAVSAMLEAFGQEATSARLRGYELGCVGLNADQVENAVAAALRRLKKVPSPAELRELSGERTSEMAAIDAWSDLQRAVPLGSYRHICFEDGLINASVRTLGGWPAMFERCGTTDGEKWYRIEFLKVYKGYLDAGVNGDACRALPGLSEQTVVDGKKCDPVPVRIGCTANRGPLIESSGVNDARDWSPQKIAEQWKSQSA